MKHAGDHEYDEYGLCRLEVDGRRCYDRRPSPRDFMRDDKWDRADLAGVQWLLLTPGMQSEMRTATLEQLVDYAASSSVSERWLAALKNASAGDWVPFKDGIAICLGNNLDPSDFED